MLMRRAIASVFNFICRLSWSIFTNFGEHSLFQCASKPEIAKNLLKPPIFRFQGRLMSSTFVPLERSSAVLVMISSKYVAICNRILARVVDSNRNRAFWWGTQIWCPRTEDSLNLRGRNLNCWNLRLVLKTLSAGCLGLSLVMLAGAIHSWDVCRSLKTRKLHQNPLFSAFKVVQGHRRWYSRKARQQCLLW